MIDMTQPCKAITGANILTVGDNNQLFSFGAITMLKKKDCIVLVAFGERAGQKVRLPLEFPATVDGVTYAMDAPEVEDVKPTRAPRAKLEEGQKTKIQMCREIFQSMPVAKFTKADVVARFIAEAKCTPAGANTYYLTILKE